MLALLLLAAAALAGSPAVPPLSAEDWADLRAREVVVRADTNSQLVESTGVVLARVAPDRLWAAVLDFQARMAENDTLVAVQEYDRTGPTDWGVRFELSVFGYRATFHNRYAWDRARSVVAYTLDGTRPNDLVVCDGWYLVEARDGGSLLVYQSRSQSKAWAPGPVLRWLANDSMAHLLAKIRDRAERG